jgi:hypothetical protein
MIDVLCDECIFFSGVFAIPSKMDFQKKINSQLSVPDDINLSSICFPHIFHELSSENLSFTAKNVYWTIFASKKQEIPCSHGKREHIFRLLVSYRAAEKVKYDF